MSKIIKMKVDVSTTKSGGGTPELIPPENLDNLISLRKYLSTIEIFEGRDVFKLNHQTFKDKFGMISTIPAPSKRYLDGIKKIFGSNKFVPLQTYYNSTYDRLDFLYYVSFNEIQNAIYRIDTIITTFNEMKTELKLTTSECFVEISNDQKLYATKKISECKKLNNLSIFSLTGILSVLSGQFSLFEKFVRVEHIVEGDEHDETEIRFVSKGSLEKAETILNEYRVNILHKGDKTITFKGNFSKKINGVVAFKKEEPILASYGDGLIEKTLEDFTYERFSLSNDEKNGVRVGVIDGGMPNDSIVKRELKNCFTSKDLDIEEEKPSGHHAEEVCSLLLWSQKLSNKTDDKLKSPDVTLFDVIKEEDTIATFKYKVQKIISENAHQIKIWNLSLSFPGEKVNDILSQVGVFLDQLQSKFNILIFVPTGNKCETDKADIINAPSGSFRAISVSAVKSNNLPVSYNKIGYGKYLNQKPDFAIYGGDDDDKIKVISNNFVCYSSGGTSFATPLAVRKGAALIAEGFKLIDIPSVLNSYATWYSIQNNIEINNGNGNGVLPINSSELFDMVGKKAIVVINTSLSQDYRQAFIEIKVPQYNERYDANIVTSINVNGKLAGYSTYEYVLDSSSFSFGKVDPFTEKVNNEITPIKTHGHTDGTSESALRIYKGKFKTRVTKISFPSRSRLSSKTNRVLGQKRNIDNWGIKFERNLIGSTRAKANKQEISVCIIFSSKNNLFFNEFINMNRIYISNFNDLTNVNSTIISNDNIVFE